jgi:hypothetical protein
VGIGIGGGLLITAITIFLGRHQLKQLRSSLTRVEALDGYFEQAFQDEITLGERLDLRAMWKGIRENMSRSLKVLSPANFPLKMTRNRHLKRLNKAIESHIPRLRRHVGS